MESVGNERAPDVGVRNESAPSVGVQDLAVTACALGCGWSLICVL